MEFRGMKTIDWIAIVLLIVGALNWGLVGLFQYNLVESVIPSVANIIYTLVGVAGLLSIFRLYQYKNKGY